MADLPDDRITADKLQLLSTEMDYFGSFEIKYGRKTLKRHRVIFTCNASWAIHLEVTAFLTTDTYISYSTWSG